jgi:hypothetical protein
MGSTCRCVILLLPVAAKHEHGRIIKLLTALGYALRLWLTLRMWGCPVPKFSWLHFECYIGPFPKGLPLLDAFQRPEVKEE